VSTSLTVVVPTRSRAELLGPTLASILAAAEEGARTTGTRTEVLVVDDASPDDGATRAVAADHGVRYHRIEEHDGRRDPGVAIAAGVQLVDTEHHLVFGDDDAMLPSHVTAALRHVLDGADVVSTSYWLTDADLVPVREVVLPTPTIGDLARGYALVNDGAVVRTALVRDLAWDPSLTGMMLLPHWVRLMLDGRVFAVSETPSWCYRRHGSNISADIPEEDTARRRELVAALQAEVVARLGVLPAGPHHDAREARIAARAAREAREAAAATPEGRAAAQAAAERSRRRNARLDIRVRRRLSRLLAP
jgi:glycosyltransferase involved in cell wall biosynthesis